MKGIFLVMVLVVVLGWVVVNGKTEKAGSIQKQKQ